MNRRPFADFADLPIADKLRRMMLYILGTAMGLALLAESLHEIDRSFGEMRDQLVSLADVVASNTQGALLFKDAQNAGQALASLRAIPSIESSALRLPDGSLLAGDRRAGDGAGAQIGWLPAGWQAMALTRPVWLDGKPIGDLQIRASLLPMWQRIGFSLAVSAVMLSIAFACAWLLLRHLAKRLTRPIVELSDAARRLSQNPDYDMHMPKHGADEVGELVDAFGAMLRQIRQRDADLRAHGDNLEREVARQTTELREAMEAAQAASVAKSQFLAGMSHEIRTPMNAIIGVADLLINSPLNEDQQGYVKIFQSAGENLLNLINDILDLSKIEAGRVALEAVPFYLGEVVEGACGMLALRAHEKGLEVSSDTRPEVPMHLTGDPARLRQVLFNLLGNAIKFTGQGEVVLTVQCETAASAGSPAMLLFSVADTGIGIEPEVSASIFDKFTQADSSTTRLYGGSGLGLAISKSLVELMGGRIWLESEPGKGSTFSFTVPFEVAEQQPPDYRDADQALLAGVKTLVLDDNDTNRRIIRRLLDDWGMPVAEADSGAAGLAELAGAHAAGEPYRLLLLDCRMPGMDGFRVAEQIRANPDLVGLTVMMLTSDNRENDAERAHAVGITSYLVKPVKRQELLDTLLRAVNAPEPAPATAPTPLPTLGPLAVLLVEDYRPNRVVVQGYLRQTPAQISVAENGAQALEIFKAGRYDVVLMDMQMPVMDGYTATREIRRYEREQGLEPTPIVALSAFALKEEIDKSLQAGCDGHLSKPIKQRKLLEHLAGYCPAAPAAPAASSAVLEARRQAEAVVNVDPVFRAFMSEYFAGLRADIAAMGAALDISDYAAICAIAHDIKGAGGSFNLHAISAIAHELGQVAKEENAPRIAACLAELAEYLARVRISYR